MASYVTFYTSSLQSTSTTSIYAIARWINTLEHLRVVLQRFKDEGMKLRLKKCFFGLQEMMEYLGLLELGTDSYTEVVPAPQGARLW
jgi:hypothetical protein